MRYQNYIRKCGTFRYLVKDSKITLFSNPEKLNKSLFRVSISLLRLEKVW